MTPLFPRIAIVVAALLAMAASSPAVGQENVPTLELGKRTGRTPYSFGTIGNVVEMRDGRVVVADLKGRAYRIVDFATNEMPMLGEPGDGPLDYRRTGPIFGGRLDSLLLFIPGTDGNRFLHLSPQGKIVAATPAAEPMTGDSPAKGTIRWGPPVGMDREGAAYYLVELTDSTGNLYELADVVRVSADTMHRVVVDYLRERRKDQLRSDRSITEMPFQYRDAWALRTDGLAARIVADSYQVSWSRNGHETGRTGLLPHTPIPVTPAEQTAFRDSLIDQWNPKPPADGGPTPNGRGASAAVTFGGNPTTGDNTPRSLTPAAPTRQLRIPGIGPYPENKPAIPSSKWQTVALFDRDGKLWVVRERAHGDNVPHIDVVEEGKGVVAHVNLPKNTKLAGFGAGVIYLVNHDDNGDWLERYGMPKL
jgi:hypothetical protein